MVHGCPQAACPLKTLCVIDDLRFCLPQLLHTVTHTIHAHTHTHIQDSVLLNGQMSGPFLREGEPNGYYFTSEVQ